jgi:hypothetical protein
MSSHYTEIPLTLDCSLLTVPYQKCVFVIKMPSKPFFCNTPVIFVTFPKMKFPFCMGILAEGEFFGSSGLSRKDLPKSIEIL